MEQIRIRAQRSPKYFKYTLTACLFLSVLLALNVFFSTSLDNLNRSANYKDISCYSQESDALPLIGHNFSTSNKSIFFIETSCSGSFNSRQACSIESAAETNPDWQIHVLVVGPLDNETLRRDPIKTLMAIENVHFSRIDIKKFTKNTLLEPVFAKNIMDKSKFTVAHSSDGLRLLTLYKYGGVYLDLDMIVVKSLNTLPKNFVSKEDEYSVASCILAFSSDNGRSFALDALREFATNYKPESWSFNGPQLILRILKKTCRKSKVADFNVNTCKGFNVLERKYFCPIHYSNGFKYFSKSPNEYKDAYTHHIWNYLTNKLAVPEDSLYVQLAKKFCPRIYGVYGANFGL